MTELELAFARVLSGEQQPVDALRFVEEVVQQAQDEVLSRR